MENKDKNIYKSNNTDKLNFTLSVRCMICDEYVKLTDIEAEMMNYGHHICNKICDKCKKAILYMRSIMPDE